MSYHSGYSGSVARSLSPAPDNYTPASTIEGVLIDRVILDVYNQAIFWQLQIAVGATGVWESAEKHMAPGSRTINRRGITGVRVRAAIPAAQLPAGTSQAVVDVEAVT